MSTVEGRIEEAQETRSCAAVEHSQSSAGVRHGLRRDGLEPEAAECVGRAGSGAEVPGIHLLGLFE